MKLSSLSRLAALLLAALMLLAPAAALAEQGLSSIELPDLRAAWDGSVASSFAGGSGTASDPYRISSSPQLAYLASRVNSGHNYAGKYFKLTSNLLINSTTGWENWYPENGPANKWTPIGKDEDNYFAGIFDGQGHTIKGLFFDHDADLRGIFGVTNGAVIKNLSVERSLTTGGDYTGVFAGAAFDTQFISCVNAGKVYAPYSDYVGGIAGYTVGCELRDCENSGAVEGLHGHYLGGIVGRASATAFTGCTNSGDFTCFNDRDAGGIVACATDGSSAVNCLNTGNMTGENSCFFGGIASEFNGVITDCINRGDITSPTAAAGIVRIHECEDTPLSGCVNEGAVTASMVAGIAYGHSGAGVVGCVNRGAITAIELSGTLGEASGIVNSCEGTVANCQNYGTVIGTSELPVYGAGITVEADAVEYCDNYGQVKVKSGSVAGVIHLSHGSVFRCTNNATVRSADKLANVFAAGIVFENYGSVSECANFGLIHAGRGAGVVSDNYEGAVVSDCFNAGSIEGNYLSGVVYESRPQDVVRCYNAGPVSGNKMKAPLICILRCEGAPVNCYYLDTSCDAEDTVGTALTDERMRSAAGYAGFDFTGVWTMEGKSDYPYAELRYGFPNDPIPEIPLMMGDVNGDGTVDSTDALLLLRWTMELAELDEQQLSRGDVNGDGIADSSDALLILRMALGLQ